MPRLVARPAPPAPAAVTLTVEGRDRASVAGALLDEAVGLEEEAARKRRGPDVQRRLRERALRLRALAAQVWP